MKYKALEWECKSLESPGSTLWGDKDMRPLFFFFFCRKFNFSLLLSKAFFSIIGTLAVFYLKVNLLPHSRNPLNVVPLYVVLHHDSIILPYNSFMVDRNSIVVDKNSIVVDRRSASSQGEAFPVGPTSDSSLRTHPLSTCSKKKKN